MRSRDRCWTKIRAGGIRCWSAAPRAMPCPAGSVRSSRSASSHIAHVSQHHRDTDLPENKKTEGAEEFFAALTRHLRQFKTLDRVRNESTSEETTGSLREQKGGDIALRGIGMAIFARAFLFCKEEGMDFDDMAARLARIEWHVLKCEKGSILLGPSYAKDVLENAQPIWSHLIVMRDSGYRISSSSNDADAAWKKISEEIFNEALAA